MIDLKGNPFFLSDEDIEWVNKTLNRLTTEEKAAQLFCVLLKRDDKETVDYIFNILKPGAFMYRVMSTEEAIHATDTVVERSEIYPLIAANLEKGGNGIVTEGTLVGSPMEIAATDDESIAAKMARACALEAEAVGANWAFAPIIDIDSNFRNPITNTRTFGSDAERVKRMGLAYVKEVQSHGLAATIKHFPGDGRDERDQHLVTSINDLSVDEWMKTYGEVYKAGIDKGVLSVMAGHIMLPAWEKEMDPAIKDDDCMPATLSKALLQGLLREKLGFNGVISTDATTMAGYMLAMGRRRAVPESIARGCDMFLFARNLEEDYHFMLDGIKEGIITKERLDEAVTRILAMKAALGLHKKTDRPDPKRAKEIIGCPQHKEWARECADKAITLVKEEKGVLPITPEKYKRILLYRIEPVGEGYSIYKTNPVIDRVKDKLIKEGFEVDEFEPQPYGEGFTSKYEEITSKYDLMLYVANLATKSNQTVVRIEWKQPMGADCGLYINDVKTVFVSLENPYHLLDFPRVKTFINCYSGNDEVVDELIKKLTGKSEFKGKSPIDPFCGRLDTRL
ncbi:MAG: glycoside hydrolase family 3 protein [Butyrivibrio sp.]|nr:glycoside hydrolase family 3 protein [Butyrivibrio sp.]